jgi:hypothetical protein
MTIAEKKLPRKARLYKIKSPLAKSCCVSLEHYTVGSKSCRRKCKKWMVSTSVSRQHLSLEGVEEQVLPQFFSRGGLLICRSFRIRIISFAHPLNSWRSQLPATSLSKKEVVTAHSILIANFCLSYTSPGKHQGSSFHGTTQIATPMKGY